MDYSNYGNIIKRSSSFIWQINDFINIIKEENFYLDSNNFIMYKGQFWFLKFFKSVNKTRNLACFRLACYSPCNINISYKLCIKDFKDEDYWTSPLLTQEFNNGNNFGAIQELCVSDLQRDANRIAPGGILFFQITFDLGIKEIKRLPTRPDNVGTTTDDPTSSTVEVGTQTGTDSNQVCSSNSEGVDKLLQNLKDLLVNEHDSDVTLNVKGKHFSCHKIILRSRSSVFFNMFEHEMVENNSCMVNITDCDPEVFLNFLVYLYTGKAELDGNSVVKLHYISRKYLIEDLATSCVKYMINNFTIESFVDFVTVGLQHCELSLIEYANIFFTSNFKQILSTEKWRLFFQENSIDAHELLIKALYQIEVSSSTEK